MFFTRTLAATVLSLVALTGAAHASNPCWDRAKAAGMTPETVVSVKATNSQHACFLHAVLKNGKVIDIQAMGIENITPPEQQVHGDNYPDVF